MVPRKFCFSRGTSFGDPEIWGPNWLGTICPDGPNFWGTFIHGDRLSRGINFMGIICPMGQKVEDRKFGDQIRTKWIRSGPNESQPSCRRNNCLCFGRYDVQGLLQSYSLAYFFLRIGLMHLQAGIRDKYPLSPYVPPGRQARWCAPVKWHLLWWH